MILHIRCFIERKTFLPILDITLTGEINPKVETRGVIILHFLKIMRVCQNMDGIILNLEEGYIIPKYVNNTVVAQFKIIFSKEEDLRKFTVEIEKNNSI